MMRPSSLPVFALNALQKSMMLTPAWPSAGPTGGAGVALPPGICSLICPTTFFIPQPLRKPQRHRGTESLIGFAPNRSFQTSLPFLCVSVPLWLKLLDLQEVQLHRGGAAEDGHHDLQGVAVEVDLLHHPLE